MESKDKASFAAEDISTQSVKYHEVAPGRKIYSLRMAKRLSQEQLAAMLNISPAAVSKWERNQSNPSIEMLWVLADLFGCSIDDLVGRTLMPTEKVGIYDEKNLRLMLIGDDLLKCSEISRAQGLLSMESSVPTFKGGSRFLAFAIPYTLNLFMKQAPLEEIFQFLGNYVTTLPEAERTEGNMITAVLRRIYNGESPKILQELIASYIGIDYREKSEKMSALPKRSREEVLAHYNDKKMYSDKTNLLEGFANVGAFEIRLTLDRLDLPTLTAALAGASGAAAKAFLSNLRDRVLSLIDEDIMQWDGTEEDILAAQKKVLDAGSFFLSDFKRAEKSG